MSIVSCCDYPREVNDSLYIKRESYKFWYRSVGTAFVISIVVFAIFNIMNLSSNPNYALFADAVTIPQLTFVIGSIVNVTVLGVAFVILRSFYQKCDELIKRHEFHK